MEVDKKVYGEDLAIITLETKVIAKLRNGQKLPPLGSKILKILLEHPQELLTFEEIIRLTWGGKKEFHPTKSVRLIDHYMVAIKRFLTQSKLEHKLHRIHGVGIYLVLN